MKKNKSKSNDMEILKMFGILLIIIFLAFAGGIFIVNKLKPKAKTEYSNGFIFTKQGNFWYTSIKNPLANQEYNVDFRYSPSELKNITVVGEPKKFFTLLQQNNLTAAYITFDLSKNITSSVTLAAADLSKFLKVINGVTLVAACVSNNTDVCSTRPIVTCENQEGKSIVIYLKQTETPKITMNKNCLTIEGQKESLVKAYTKLLFIWYNII